MEWHTEILNAVRSIANIEDEVGIDWYTLMLNYVRAIAVNGGSGGGFNIAYTSSANLPPAIGGSSIIAVAAVTPVPDASCVGKFITDTNGVIARIDSFDASAGLSVTTVALGVTAGIPDAPNDNKTYARKNQAWNELSSDLFTSVHTQSIPLSTWDIAHNLNQLYVSVQIINGSGDTVIADITFLSANTLRLSFTAPTSGTAVIRR
jgi:hypothetical protein